MLECDGTGMVAWWYDGMMMWWWGEGEEGRSDDHRALRIDVGGNKPLNHPISTLQGNRYRGY